MTVEILRLSGLDDAAAMTAAERLLDAREKHPDLSRTLVVDDTAALAGHEPVYDRLLTSRRLERLLCVAVGPRDCGQRIVIPPNIRNSRGSAVIWVGDPRGVDWRLSTAAFADGHTGSTGTGLDHLLEVLSADKVYDRVRATTVGKVRGGVANPGLRLAGTIDEAASFPVAFALAVARLTGIGAAAPAHIAAPLAVPPSRTAVASLPGEGELAGYQARIAGTAASVAESLAGARGGLFRRGGPDVRESVLAIGRDLRAFRDRVARLFQEAQAIGELSDTQRGQVAAAGVLLPARAPGGDQDPFARTTRADSGRSALSAAVLAAIRGGDTLSRVSRGLATTEQLLAPKGSVSYLREVEAICPSALLDRLAGVGPRPSGKAAAESWRHGLGVAEAERAADGLAALVVQVANREWSAGAAVAGEASRLRIALDAVGERLTEHAADGGIPAVSGTQAERLARLGESLTPVLCDLVDTVIAAESATPSAGGQGAYDRARDTVDRLVGQWEKSVAANGALARPPFATSDARQHTYVVDDVAALRDALRDDPRQKMWQLCSPDELGALDAAADPLMVTFAPETAKKWLAEHVPKDTEWTPSGAYGGLLRLVPLRSGIVPDEDDGWAADEVRTS